MSTNGNARTDRPVAPGQTEPRHENITRRERRAAILAGPVKLHAVRLRSAQGRAIVGAIVLPLIAIVLLLVLGRLLVAFAPVSVEIESDGEVLRVAVDGTTRLLPISRPIVVVRPVAPPAYRREHQIDGSDSTNMLSFDPKYFAEFGDSPYYQFQAILREEWRYSRWTNLEVVDQAGRSVLREAYPPDGIAVAVPGSFRLTIGLERPEIPRALELIDDEQRSLTLEINRNDKQVRIGSKPVQDATDLASWYFPREPAPFAATLLDLVTLVLALALGLLLVAGVLAVLLPAASGWQPGRRSLLVALPLGLVWLLAASWYVGTALFDRAPHILDAIAYTFQSKMFVAGMLTATPPPPSVLHAFPMPFSAIYRDRWFIQYPPGTAALQGLGLLVGLPWLVQPLLAAGAVVLIVLTAGRQYGPGTALLVLGLLVTSPFLLLTAGSFLSHVPALFFASVALYAATRYAERPALGWAALVAVGLGLAFLTREVVGVLFGLTVILAGLTHGFALRGRAVVRDIVVMGLIVGATLGLYLGYNAILTGVPFLLPRLLVDGRDRYGFGPGVGFYNEHTLAAGFVNTEEQLVSLGFYLAGWPFGFSLALLLLPFLTRRLRPWDVAYGLLVVGYVVSYAAYYYHGIAFGPRYLFEALPAFVILTARGFAALTEAVAAWLMRVGFREGRWRARQATGLIVLALFACNAGYFLPRQAALYAHYSGIPGGGPSLDDATIRFDLAGRTPRLANALVVADEWWWYAMYFAALNCPELDCPTLFAVASTPEVRAELRRAFPERDWYNVVLRGGVLTIVPGAP